MLYVTSHSFLLETCVFVHDTCRFVHVDVLMAVLLVLLCGCQACSCISWPGAGGLSSPKGAQVSLAGREDHLAPFSVRGTALDVGTFVIGDMGKDNSLRHHLRAVIDELGLRAPPSPPPTSPSRPVPPSSSCLH